MGVKRTGDLLEKLTWGFAITLVVLTLATHVILDNSDISATNRSVNQERAASQPGAPAALPQANPAQQQGEGVAQPAVATPGASPVKKAQEQPAN
jgi:preprotein translocase subunit SecG